MPTLSGTYQLSTTDAVVLKDGNIFFLTKRDGSVPLGGKHGLGLYYHDCRFLDAYELRVGGVPPQGLAASAASPFSAILQLTNPEIPSLSGAMIQSRRLGIQWERIIDSGTLALLDRLTFCLPERNFYAMALQRHNRPLSVISSNSGQALWSGIVDPNRARLVAGHLMREDMFSGWGIRTLSTLERRYNPIGYHLGSVWPHDNSIIALGLRKYGLDDDFQPVFRGTLEAASRLEHHRLPELFTGFARDQYDLPVPYPEACHPQVWAAGAIPMMLQTALGIVPLGFEKRLRIVRPLLPDSVHHLEVRRLKVASASVNLRYERTPERRDHHLGQRNQRICPSRFEGAASVHDQERQDRTSRHSQGNGPKAATPADAKVQVK